MRAIERSLSDGPRGGFTFEMTRNGCLVALGMLLVIGAIAWFLDYSKSSGFKVGESYAF